MPKISIIIPLYNKALYVAKALESIASQTYTDWECIIVNDGSTDNSAQIVREWVGGKSEEVIGKNRFQVIDQENAGVSAARNRGISEALNDERLTMNDRCEYVCFLDADDWWASSFLEEMIRFAKEYPEAGLWASNYIYYKPGKTRVGVKNVETGYINYPKAYYENNGQVVWTGAVMISRGKIEEVKAKNGEVFPVGIKLGEDFLLWSRIALLHKVAFLNKPLAYYNNDIPASLRLTHHLHAPETHMLWQLGDIEDRIQKIEDDGLREDWKRLLDKLRVNGLMDYWMSDEYHDAAAKELEKVTVELPKVYKQPIWWLRANKNIKCIGSYCKQKIIRK